MLLKLIARLFGIDPAHRNEDKVTDLSHVLRVKRDPLLTDIPPVERSHINEFYLR